MCLETTINADTKMDMNEVKRKLNVGEGDYHPNFTTYLATRLEDNLSPREFYQQTHQVIREMINNRSSDSSKPIPQNVAIYATEIGNSLLQDIGIIAIQYCPVNFAKAVKAVQEKIN